MYRSMASPTKDKRQPEPWKTAKGKAKSVKATLEVFSVDSNGATVPAVCEKTTVVETVVSTPKVTKKSNKKPLPGLDATTALQNEFFNITQSRKGASNHLRGNMDPIMEDIELMEVPGECLYR